MGYSSRYHAASLAAVFVALAVGILIGAALGSDVISGTAEKLKNDLAQDLDRAQAENSDLKDENEALRSFDQQVYPAIVGNRLNSRSIALITLGDVETGTLEDDVSEALDGSGADLGEVASVREPPDTDALIDDFLSDSARFQTTDDALRDAATVAGRALVGRGPELNVGRNALLSGFSGNPQGITGVVIVRQAPVGLSPREMSDIKTLEEGLIEGMKRSGARVVGGEREDAQSSSVEFFTQQQLPTVDNVEQFPGRVALVLALAGADGNFGVKETADGLLPDLVDGAQGHGGG